MMYFEFWREISLKAASIAGVHISLLTNMYLVNICQYIDDQISFTYGYDYCAAMDIIVSEDYCEI